MAMPAQSPEWTAADAIALPTDGNRYEVLDGELFVTPAPSWSHQMALEVLAVEVLSPSTARADRHRKRLIYQRHGVPEYWIVDVDAQCIERWRPDDARPEVLAEQLMWQPRAEVAPLMLELPVLFAEIHR